MHIQFTFWYLSPKQILSALQSKAEVQPFVKKARLQEDVPERTSEECVPETEADEGPEDHPQEDGCMATCTESASKACIVISQHCGFCPQLQQSVHSCGS